MRLPVALLSLFLAAPACALDVQDLPTWSAEAHVVKGQTSRDTVLVFTRTGPGAWSVRAECQTTDVRTRKWQAHRGTGTARLHQGFVIGELGGLGRVVVAADRLSIDSPHCASGEVILGTGD
jgi:hypothetical protein